MVLLSFVEMNSKTMIFIFVQTSVKRDRQRRVGGCVCVGSFDFCLPENESLSISTGSDLSNT